MWEKPQVCYLFSQTIMIPSSRYYTMNISSVLVRYYMLYAIHLHSRNKMSAMMMMIAQKPKLYYEHFSHKPYQSISFKHCCSTPQLAASLPRQLQPIHIPRFLSSCLLSCCVQDHARSVYLFASPQKSKIFVLIFPIPDCAEAVPFAV